MRELALATFNTILREHGNERGEGFHMDILAYDSPADHKVWTCNPSEDVIRDVQYIPWMHSKNTGLPNSTKRLTSGSAHRSS